jgi:hypothetical protein
MLDRVDDITALLLNALTDYAIDDYGRHVWWRALTYALSNDKPRAAARRVSVRFEGVGEF